MQWKTKLCNQKWRKLWLLLLEQQKNHRSSLFFSRKFTGLLFPRTFYGAQNGSFTEEKDKAGLPREWTWACEKVFTNKKKKRVLIQPGERRRNQVTNKSNEQSEKYSPLWKCSKLFIPPQTDGMIRFSFNIGWSESKVIFKWRKTKATHKKKAFREEKVHTLCISFSLSQNSLCEKQTNSRTRSTHRKACLEPVIRDAQKLAQNVFPPWMLSLPLASSGLLFVLSSAILLCFNNVVLPCRYFKLFKLKNSITIWVALLVSGHLLPRKA